MALNVDLDDWRTAYLMPRLAEMLPSRAAFLSAWFDRASDAWRDGIGGAEDAFRDGLIGIAMEGALSPELVEKLSVELGLGPLARTPALPLDAAPTELSWTLPMALAWIEHHSFSVVGQYQDTFRTKCWVWRSVHRVMPVPAGVVHTSEVYEVHAWELVTLDPARVSDVTGETIAASKQALMEALSEGRIEADAYDMSGGFIEIEPRKWARLVENNDRAGLFKINGVDMYRKVTVPVASVLKVFRARKSSAVSKNPSAGGKQFAKRAAAVAGMAKILRSEFRDPETDLPTDTQSRIWEREEPRFISEFGPTASYNAFIEAWKTGLGIGAGGGAPVSRRKSGSRA